MLQPLRIHLLSLSSRLDMKILSLFTQHHTIFHSDHILCIIYHVLWYPLHFLHLRFIASLLVTLLIFAHLLFSYVFFLHPPQNEDCINCTFIWHKAELHIIYCYNFSPSFLKYLFNNFIACSSNFTPLHMPQFMISPFPLKIGIANTGSPVFWHSFAI